ncbi:MULTISPECIES: hypothetical protein [Devosia]|uniref:Uncharacterized protein n=1 Tax=Devosia equisanguinis TaxID=2490941 RepID=A0A447I990_9HYPH|nr:MULTISPECIES: hypothetical protein [Devosia]ODT47672.1 MAG: hypothetical protein ABS74_15630 [Pelagibacterium sp. SCN 63-126]ODU88269.1 MAG: hypothetical protein ABT14_03510 [Pelagibacterium sp. SCN 63-17]OJX42620.1 MAG: hypothetical protein BGO80_14230 [Devosia sp. 63-57]VDS03983.1 hypothetical protein DEVEQU_01112 [Devosia equisanguinis]
MVAQRETEAAKVDFLVDENGSRIDVPDDSGIRVAGEHEASVGGTGPTNWWLYGLIALGIVIAFLLVLQLFSGAPGTDVQPGTPTSQPVTEQMAPASGQ